VSHWWLRHWVITYHRAYVMAGIHRRGLLLLGGTPGPRQAEPCRCRCAGKACAPSLCCCNHSKCSHHGLQTFNVKFAAPPAKVHTTACKRSHHSQHAACTQLNCQSLPHLTHILYALCICSASKALVAITGLLQQQKGLLSLDAHLSAYLPCFDTPELKAKQGLTLRSVLCHTSGTHESSLVTQCSCIMMP
jgi:hypothetical protein